MSSIHKLTSEPSVVRTTNSTLSCPIMKLLAVVTLLSFFSSANGGLTNQKVYIQNLTIEDYLYKYDLPAMDDFTYCLWLDIEDGLKECFPVSIATRSDSNHYLYGWQNMDTSNSRTNVLGSGSSRKVPMSAELLAALENGWHRHCFVTKKGQYVKWFMDKQTPGVVEEMESGASLSAIPAGAALVLLQDQDSFQGGFQLSQVCQSKMSMFNMWNRAMTLRELNQLSCQDQGNVVNMDNIDSMGAEPVYRSDRFPCKDVCPAPKFDVSMKPGETAAKVKLPTIELMAPAGEIQLVTKLSDGTSCNTSVTVKAAEVICPSTISAEIPAGAASVSVNWPLPSTIGIEGDEIECVSCPSVPQDLTAGLHNIAYEYKHKPSDVMIGCSFDILVADSAEQCTSDAEKCGSGLSKGKQNATFNLKSADGKITPIDFPVGMNTLEIVSESGLICTKTIEVLDKTPVRSSVDLIVKYDVDCDNLNPFSWAVINSSLLHHYTNLIYACDDCGLAENWDPPKSTCESDTLSVSWPTNITFPQEDVETDPWPAKKADLVSKLMKVQADHVKLTGRYFVITVIMQNPPVVPPRKGVDDLYVYPEVVSTCPIEELVYDEDDDACYIFNPTK